jgi:UDP-N-acetylmuramate dehydrogenase
VSMQPKGLRENVDMAPLTTMRVGGRCDYFVSVSDVAGVRSVCDWAAQQDINIFVLGEGSNIIVSDRPIHRVVLKMDIPGFEIVREDDTSAVIRIGAGEHWDDVVARTVTMGLSGIEAMSMIPGTAGATPVQNAGAYGQEIADTLAEVEAYDIASKSTRSLSKSDCEFGYRSSAFKTSLAGRFIILGLMLKLRKSAPPPPTYASLKRWCEAEHIEHPTVAQIRRGVMSIRSKILPDPSTVPNSGSFFKNPIVSERELNRLKLRYPGIPFFEHDNGYKLAAGWLLDSCGFKGAEHFGLRMHARHALVITNPEHAAFSDLMQLVELVITTVYRKFGVTLEPEPQFIT